MNKPVDSVVAANKKAKAANKLTALALCVFLFNKGVSNNQMKSILKCHRPFCLL